MTPLRVAYLPPSLRPGGAELMMLALAEGLPRDRFAVDFLAMSGPGPFDERARAAGARVRYVGEQPRLDDPKLRRVRIRLAKTAGYVRAARAGHYDVIDAWLYPVDVMAVLARPLTRTPVVITGRYNLRDFNPPMSAMERRLNNLANRRVDAVIANSDAVAADTLAHEEIDPAKIHVIRNGVDPIKPLTAEEVRAGRQELGIADGELVIGSVASYTPVKRHDLLISAFAALRAEGLNVRLVMIGEGPTRPDLERQIDELGLGGVARLTGRISDPRKLLGLFDIVAQTSRSEGLPNALIEAAAAARPMVSTAAGGCGEVVLDGKTGLLVPVDDATAIAAAMRRLLTDEELRRRMGQAALELAGTQFTTSRFIGDYARLYEDLARAKGVLR